MRLSVRVEGRPAPEGSHEVGANGFVMHSSRYLTAWRAAVNKATREAYVAAGLTGADMPLIPYPRPVHLIVHHVVLDEQCRAEGTAEPTGSPDDDKLLRATIDGLGEARAFGNDSQVTQHFSMKRRPYGPGEPAGAYIEIGDALFGAPPTEGESMAQGFTPNGEYRLVLERVGTDSDGDKTWETLIEVTDTPEAIASTWLPSLGARLGAEPAAPAAETAEQGKARRTRRAKPDEPASAPQAAEPAPAAPVQPASIPVPQTVAEAVAAPARVNPFAKQLG